MTHRAIGMFSLLILLGACDAIPTGTGSASSGGSATDLTSYQGASASGSEAGIVALGYEKTRSEGSVEYWYNSATAACARMASSDGRYASVVMVPHGEC